MATKVHLSETCDGGHGSDPGGDPGVARPQPPLPDVITNVATTHAAVPDSAMTTPIHQALVQRELLPAEHYLDSGYPSVALVAGALRDFGVELVSPLLADTSPQARADAGFDRVSFDIDFDARQARCPQDKISSSGSSCTQRGTDAIVIKFDTTTCAPCPVRGQCTTAKRAGRQLTVPPRELHQAQLAAHSAQHSTDTGGPGTPSGPAPKPPCTKPSPRPAHVMPATAAWPKPTSSTCSPPSPST